MPTKFEDAIAALYLCDGALSVGIAPDCGAALTRFDVKVGTRQVPILRHASVAEIKVRSPYGAACFPLIPYASRLREGKFEFRGHEITFPINAPGERHSYHGDAWLRPWQLVELTRSKAVLYLGEAAAAPLRYQARRTVEVRAGSMTITHEIRNCEQFAIPVGTGIHPYFARRSAARLSARVPIRWRMDAEILPVAPEENPQAREFEHGLAASELPVSAAYSGWDGSAVIEWPSERVRVRISTEPPLQHAIAWAPEGQEFFCFEPVSHATNSFNLAREAVAADPDRVLDPGDSWQQSFSFAVSQT